MGLVRCCAHSQIGTNCRVHDVVLKMHPCTICKGAIQVLRNAGGGRGINFSLEKHHEGVRFNVISVTISREKSVT